MKKFIYILFIMFFSVLPAAAKSIEFAIVSDSHLVPSNHPTMFTASEKNLIFTVDSINRNKNVKFVVFLGDCIDKSRMDSLQSFMNIVQNLNKPYYMVFGNHDSYSVGGVPKEEFMEFVHQYNRRQPKKDSSFYFKAGANAYGLVADGSSYVVPGRHGRYLPELLTEIEKLLKHKKNDMIFIFQHFPLIPPNDNVSHNTLDVEPYFALLEKYHNVVLIASGHFHHKNLIVDKNGIYHISAPALGARASSDGSGCYEIITVDYDKSIFSKPCNIKVQVKDVQI